MGFITVPDMKHGNDNSSLLKFRLAFNKFDLGIKKSVTEFLTVTAFGKMADRVYADIQNNLNHICCFCDVRVRKYASKSGAPVEHTEFIINDYRIFQKPKSETDKNREFANNHPANSKHGKHVASMEAKAAKFDDIPY